MKMIREVNDSGELNKKKRTRNVKREEKNSRKGRKKRIGIIEREEKKTGE